MNGENAIQIYEGQGDIVVSREPAMVLNEAHKAAKALNDVVAKKKKKVVFNGEQYLEFEDWQTVGRFYNITVKVISTSYLDCGGAVGFEAKAVALRDGVEISAAEAMCLNDERNWKGKPLFQLRSMAQTRACAKAFRNVLAWVVVLAGYKPTPAEEMQDIIEAKATPVEKAAAKTKPEFDIADFNPDDVITNLKKNLSDMMTKKGIRSKERKIEFFNTVVGDNPTVDALQAFIDSFDEKLVQFLDSNQAA